MSRRRIRSPLLIGIAAATLVLAGAMVGHRVWRARTLTLHAQAGLPQRPELAGWPAELRHRIDACEARVRSGDGAAEALGELSRLYHANGFVAEAMQAYATLEVIDTREPRWPHRHAVLLAGYGEAEPALALWQRVREIDPDVLIAAFRIGDLLLKQNKQDDAAAVFNDVLRRHPDDPYALLGLARCDIDAGRWSEARSRLERVVELTRYELGYDLIVTVYEQLGLHDRALDIRSRMMASGAYRDPPDPWTEELYQDCYDTYQLSLSAGAVERNGDVATAIQRLERALRLAPEQASFHFQLGTMLARHHEPARARTHLERCTQLDPKFPDAWSHLSQLLLDQGDRTGAERAIAQGLVHNPQSYGLQVMRARRAQEAGRLQDAIHAYQAAIRQRSNSADPRIELAMTYFRLNALDEGAAELRAALQAEPEHPTALATLAMHAIATGDEAGARQWLERCGRQPRVVEARIQELTTAFRRQFGRGP